MPLPSACGLAEEAGLGLGDGAGFRFGVRHTPRFDGNRLAALALRAREIALGESTLDLAVFFALATTQPTIAPITSATTREIVIADMKG